MIKNFIKIGEYIKPNQDPTYEEFIGKNKTKKIPIVYLFVVNKQIKYIGESRRGYYRPLSYNKNNVMRQRLEILKITTKNIKVEVFAYEVPTKKVCVNDMEVDTYIAQDYEKALIIKYNPEWNGRS